MISVSHFSENDLGLTDVLDDFEEEAIGVRDGTGIGDVLDDFEEEATSVGVMIVVVAVINFVACSML